MEKNNPFDIFKWYLDRKPEGPTKFEPKGFKEQMAATLGPATNIYSLANFKAFSEKQQFEIKPITLLYGPNSSGKSSIIQSMAFIDSMLRSRISDPDIDGGCSDKDIRALDNFTQVVHKKDRSKKIEIGYKFYTPEHLEDGVVFTVGCAEPFHRWNTRIEKYDIYRNSKQYCTLVPFGGNAIDDPDDSDDLIIQSIGDGSPLWEILSKGKSALKNRIPDGENGDQLMVHIAASLRVKGFHSLDGECCVSFDPFNQMDFWENRRNIWDLPEIASLIAAIIDDMTSVINRVCVGVWLNSSSHGNRYYYSAENVGPVRTSRNINSQMNKTSLNNWLGKDFLNTIYEVVDYKEIDRVNFESFLSMAAEIGATQKNARQAVTKDELQKIYSAYANKKSYRLRDRRTGQNIDLEHVGFGFTQLLEMLDKLVWGFNRITIEQPEIHLHPAMQAELGDVFIDVAKKDRYPGRCRLIIETHSEHILLRIMRRMRESNKLQSSGRPSITPADVGVYYVKPTPEGSLILEMPLSEDGRLLKAWPGGFFEEDLREMLE